MTSLQLQVYLLECADHTVYVGQTRYFEKRMREHHSGKKPDSYTAKRLSVKLIWHQAVATREEALALEKRLKKWSAGKKRALAAGNEALLHELAKCRNETRHDRPERGHSA